MRAAFGMIFVLAGLVCGQDPTLVDILRVRGDAAAEAALTKRLLDAPNFQSRSSILEQNWSPLLSEGGAGVLLRALRDYPATADPVALYYRARIAAHLKLPEEALDALDRALRLDPGSAPLLGLAVKVCVQDFRPADGARYAAGLEGQEWEKVRAAFAEQQDESARKRTRQWVTLVLGAVLIVGLSALALARRTRGVAPAER